MQETREALELEERAEGVAENQEQLPNDEVSPTEETCENEREKECQCHCEANPEEAVRDEEGDRQDESDQDASESFDADDGQSSSSMSHLMLEMAHDLRTFRRGDIVEGTIVSIDKDGIMVDIGTKSEAIIPGHEASRYLSEGKEQVQVGDQIVACVVQSENSDGHAVLSLSRARVERGWRQVQKLFDDGQSAEAEVVDHNKGGLIVNIHNVRGFVPISQIVGLRQNTANDEEIESKLTGMVGTHIQIRVLEINRRRNRLILSERAAMSELRAQRKEQLLNELQEGEIRRGKVSSVCDFGAFIDLGGADGLVHLSELSWGQISHPSDAVKVGDEVDVKVLSVDHDKKKIALSIRRTQPEPWSLVGDKYQPGDVVTATVTKLATFGAFARVEPGVEGLIHVSELAEGRVAHPSNLVKEGDVLTVRVIRVDPEHRRLGLSLRQAPKADEGETSEQPEDQANTAEETATVATAETEQAESTGEHPDVQADTDELKPVDIEDDNNPDD